MKGKSRREVRGSAPHPAGAEPRTSFFQKTAAQAALVTQFYVAGEPQNQRDVLFNRLRDEHQREAVPLRLPAADRIEPGALLAERGISCWANPPPQQ